MNKRLHPSFPKKDDLRITKNKRSIILTAIAAKVYNPCFPFVSDLKSKKLSRKIRTAFEETVPHPHRF